MNNRSPLVCICLPTYNAESTIAETLQSLIVQTYTNILIKVVDNASTDNTLSVVETLSDPRISIYRGKSNIGGEGNFNRCIDLATGEYTAIFHADDIYEPTMIARQVAEFEARPEVGAVFTESTLIDESGKPIGAVVRPRALRGQSYVYNFQEIFKATLRYSNFLMCPSAMLRTRIYREEIKSFRVELFGSSADLDVWLRVLGRHRIAILPDRLIRYRISTTQGSHTLGRRRTERADFFRVIDHYLEKPVVRNSLSNDDLRNKTCLERADRIVRASNLFLQDRPGEVLALCEGAFSYGSLLAAFRSRRGFQTLLLAVYLRSIIFLSLTSPGKAMLRWLKRVARR